MKLAQTTDYPYDGKVRISVLSGGGPITLRLLAPHFLVGQRLTLNGALVPATVEDGYLVAKINPKVGDVLVLDQSLRLVAQGRGSAGMPGYYMMEAGPLVLGYAPKDQVDPEAAEMYVVRGTKIVPGAASATWSVMGLSTVVGRINDLNDGHAGPNEPCARQILFRG
jgi:DUF1680 family protein